MNIIKWLFGDITDKFWQSQRNRPFKTSTPAKGGATGGAHNHNRKSSKIRRKMAKASRRINRKNR